MSSVVYEHALSFYQSLENEAKEESIDEAKLLIFRGSITRAFRRLGISQAHYSPVRKALIELGSISIIQQGARNRDSVVALHHRPDADEFQVTKDRLTPNLSVATLQQQVSDLQRSMGGLNVVELAINFEKRLRELEREVQRIGKSTPEPKRRV